MAPQNHSSPKPRLLNAARPRADGKVRQRGLMSVALRSVEEKESFVRYVGSNGSTQAQFMQDRYACYQETLQRVSTSKSTQYFGASKSHLLVTCNALQACLAARGYLREDTTNPDDLKKPAVTTFRPAPKLTAANSGKRPRWT